MTTFDRHIIRRFLTGTLFLTGVLILFFIVLHYVEYVDDFFDRGASTRDVFLIYYPSYVPEIVYLITPLAVFIACVYMTGRLAQSLQFVALQTSGVSLYRILRPYLVVGVLIAGFLFWFNGWVVPSSNAVRLDFEARYLKDAPQQVEVSDIHRQNRPGSVVSVGYYDREANVAHRVSLQQFAGRRHLLRRVDAPRMSWIDSLGVWRLQNASVRTFTDAGREQLRRLGVVDTVLNVLPRDMARSEQEVAAMTIPEAAAFVAELQRSGAAQIGEPLVGYYVKYTYPLASLILVLIGVPLAAVRRRGGQAAVLGLGLLTAFSYLAVQKITEPFGYTGSLSPLFTAVFPHALFLAVALVILWRVRK